MERGETCGVPSKIILPHLVAQHDQVERLGQRADRLQRGTGQQRAGGVVGRVEQDETRARRDRSGQIAHVQIPCRCLQADEDRDAARALDQRHIGVIERLDTDHLVPRFDQRQNAGRQRFGRAGGDDDFLGLDA
jgi:hypothetical protein